MVELISKVSKGSRMDQVYISKKRAGFDIGSYVVIRPLKTGEETVKKPFFYNIAHLEPIKIKIIDEIFRNIEKLVEYDNIIITGSFLERGFRFNDIDIIIVSNNKIDAAYIKKILNKRIGAEFHIVSISSKALIKGISTDPLYKAMLTKCVSRKRFMYKAKPKINYKLLDIHLLKSKLMIDNFDFLTGNEKYGMTRNLVAISQFINKKGATKDTIDLAIDRLFGHGAIQRLKDNVLSKKNFLAKYKKIYKDTQNKILRGIEDDSK